MSGRSAPSRGRGRIEWIVDELSDSGDQVHRPLGVTRLSSRAAPHVKNCTAFARRAQQPFALASIAQSERPTTDRSRRHAHVAARAVRHGPGSNAFAQCSLLGRGIARLVVHRVFIKGE